MLTVFFDQEGILHHGYARRGKRMIKKYYLEVLKLLRYTMRRKRPDLWRCGNWMLHDNASVHISRLIQQFLVKHCIVQLE